jgi:hypothetical protein
MGSGDSVAVAVGGDAWCVAVEEGERRKERENRSNGPREIRAIVRAC